MDVDEADQRHWCPGNLCGKLVKLLKAFLSGHVETFVLWQWPTHVLGL